MPTYIIDSYFKQLLPVHDEATYKRLEQQIIEEGCLDPLRIWKGHGIIIDGMTRFEICTKHDIKFNIIEMEFANREEVELWIYFNQLSHRDLTDKERKYYLGKLYGKAKEENASLDKKKKKNVLQNLSESTGESESTIQRAEVFAELLDSVGEVSPELKKAILDETIDVPFVDLKEVAEEPNKKEAAKKAKAIVSGTKEKEKEEKPIRDSLGNIVTNVAYHEIFSDVELFHEILRDIRGVEGKIRRLCQAAGGFGIHEDEMKLTRIKDELSNRIPWCICTTCKGSKAVMVNEKLMECPDCAGFGVLTKFSFDRQQNKKKKK